MISRLLGMTLASFAVVGFAAGGDDPKDTDKAIDGNWIVSKAERAGTARDEPVGDKVSFAGGKMTIVPDEDPDRVQTATIKLDPSKDPRQIDLTPDRPDGADGEAPTLKGIYKVEDGTLTILLSAPNEERPGDFRVKEGTRSFLVVLDRPKE
jgi:uncharacterized protein (TIGR03067 family)